MCEKTNLQGDDVRYQLINCGVIDLLFHGPLMLSEELGRQVEVFGVILLVSWPPRENRARQGLRLYTTRFLSLRAVVMQINDVK